MHKVYDYDTGQLIGMTDQARLIEESLETSVGAVTAFLNNGRWYYADPSMRDGFEYMGYRVETVWVE